MSPRVNPVRKEHRDAAKIVVEGPLGPDGKSHGPTDKDSVEARYAQALADFEEAGRQEAGKPTVYTYHADLPPVGSVKQSDKLPPVLTSPASPGPYKWVPKPSRTSIKKPAPARPAPYVTHKQEEFRATPPAKPAIPHYVAPKSAEAAKADLHKLAQDLHIEKKK